ncbi:GNAT family N-acetyltransferase [Anaerophilus nitritogenes]|uniref:GNAT family N-acetyltransferase n=1 Tax=Anaerophilus nitritogenes TaxID=2498136 RepID=UPI00101D594F|nr:GNAT family N-acetyltransferase [Anaerophilus nitritogenes]
MYLKEIRSLSKRSMRKMNGKVSNLKVYLVQDFNVGLLKNMVNFGLNIFGELGMDEWGLVPQIRHGNVYVLKEENKKEIVGIAIFMRDWEKVDQCYLFDYAISPVFQGKGLGYSFLKILCKELRCQGFVKISLTVDIENTAAIKLYKDKMGFKIESFSKDEYGKGHDRYIMELDLEDISINLEKVV